MSRIGSTRPAAAPRPAPTAERVYTVKQGDTLSAIAKAHGTTVAALAKANGITNPDLIFPGQRFRLPSAPPAPRPAPDQGKAEGKKAEGKKADKAEGKKAEKAEGKKADKAEGKKAEQKTPPPAPDTTRGTDGTGTVGEVKLDKAGLPVSIAAQLKTQAEALNARGVEGVELSTRLMGQATEHYGKLPGLSAQQRHDAVMRDLAAVFLGPSAPHFLEVYKTTSGKSSPDIERFLTSFGEMDLKAVNARGQGASANNIDPTAGLGFKAGLRDGSTNQVYHSFNYTFLRYVTDDGVGVLGGNLKHELFDTGNTPEDFNAALWGAEVGERFRNSREGGEAEGVYTLPVLWGASMGVKGDTYGDARQPWNHGRDYSTLAGRLHEQAEAGAPGNWLERKIGDLGGALVALVANARKDEQVEAWFQEKNKELGIN